MKKLLAFIIAFIPWFGCVSQYTPDKVFRLTDEAKTSVVVVQALNCCATGIVVANKHGKTYVLTADHFYQFALLHLSSVDNINAKLVKEDPQHDLALLSIGLNNKYKPLKFAKPELQSEVYLMGYTPNYYGHDHFMIEHGYISCMDWDGYVCANTGGREGQSGGPMVNNNGEIVGVFKGLIKSDDVANYTMCIFVPGDIAEKFVKDNIK